MIKIEHLQKVYGNVTPLKDVCVEIHKGDVVSIIGPSGTGKSTVIHKVMERMPLFFSVSCTTRPMREGEKDGVDYFFIDREQFQTLIDNGELLEYAEYAGCFYGTPRKPAEEQMKRGNHVILDIEVQGAEQVREKMPDAVSIFLMPPNWEELERRLRGRGTDNEEKILRRLETARSELKKANSYDYLVINDRVEDAADRLYSILVAECSRMTRCLPQFTDMI